MNICFVATELLGLHKNGGIGTATSHLAILLARRGHSITLLYVGRSPIDISDPWIQRYKFCGIKLVRLDPEWPLFRPELMRDTCAVHDFLVDTPFDAIVFQDWQGIGYASAMAKAAGLSFANSALLVIAHGPTEWVIDANRRVASGVLELSHIQMERSAYSNADAVIAPSGYISD